MRSGRWLSAWLALSLAVTTSGAAFGDGEPSAPPANREAQRAQLYREGLDLAAHGRWDLAVDKFRRVVALRSAPPALFTLAQAEENVGRFASAERTYRQALADARATGNREVADASEAALRAVAPRVPAIVVRVAGVAGPAPADAVVGLDGHTVAAAEPVRVDPGAHAVDVRADGMRPASTTVDVHEAETRTVTVTLTPEERPHPTAVPGVQRPSDTNAARARAPEESFPPRSSPVGPIVLAGAGLVAGVAGVVVRLGGQRDYDAAASRCTNGRCPDVQLRDEGNAGRTRIVAGTLVLAAGGLAMGGAAVWWLIGRSAHAPARADVAVEPSPDGVFARARARW